MTNTPSTAPLGTTSGTTTSTTDLPYPQRYSLGDSGYKADVGATAHQLSGSANPTATSVTIPLGSLSPEGNILFDAKSATVVIANGATGQTITDAHLQFTDTIGGQTVSIDYPCAGIGQWAVRSGVSLPTGVTLGTPMSIAANAYQTFTFPLNKGILKNAQLVLTYATAPTAGMVSAQALLSSQYIPSYAIAPMKLFSCTAAALTASANFTVQLSGVFHRNASMRSVILYNNSTGANSGAIYIFGFDTNVSNGATRNDATFKPMGNPEVSTAINNLNYATFSDSFYSANAENQTSNTNRIADVVDGLSIQIIWSATAATQGSFDCWVSQQIR